MLRQRARVRRWDRPSSRTGPEQKEPKGAGPASAGSADDSVGRSHAPSAARKAALGVRRHAEPVADFKELLRAFDEAEELVRDGHDTGGC